MKKHYSPLDSPGLIGTIIIFEYLKTYKTELTPTLSSVRNLCRLSMLEIGSFSKPIIISPSITPDLYAGPFLATDMTKTAVTVLSL